MLTNTESTEIKGNFAKLFEIYEQALNGQKSHPIHKIRKTAIKRLSEDLEFPTTKNEDWKYTRISPLLRNHFSVAGTQIAPGHRAESRLFDDLDVYKLVFVDGNFDENLSAFEGLSKFGSVMEISDALTNAESAEKVRNVLVEWSESSDNPFILLNNAFTGRGIFIDISKNQQVDKPIHLVNLSTSTEKPLITSPQRIFLIGEQSEVTFLETFENLGVQEAPYFINLVNHFSIGANAAVRHIKIQLTSDQTHIVNNSTAEQAKDSRYHAFSLDFGGNLVRNNLNAILKDSGTHTDMYGIFHLTGGQHVDNQTFIDHAFPHCSSNELYKGILLDKSKGVFNGKVIVRPDAQKTNAFQQNNTLVLSEDASMDSKPQLEIYADDVRCSHGATIGQLDEDAIYYLRSRGLSKYEAEAMLQNAFLKEVTKLLNIYPIRKELEKLIDHRLS